MAAGTTTLPKLQPPGAGLPAFEQARLRPGFHVICAVMSRRAALRLFLCEGEKVLSLARRVSTEEGAIPVLIDRIVGIEDRSRCWSVFMVLDELRIVNEGIALIIDDLTHDRPFAQEVRIQDVKPSPDSGPETIERFIQVVAAYEAAVARLGTLGRDMRHPHPWFGPMTARDWHCLAGICQLVYRRQVARVVW